MGIVFPLALWDHSATLDKAEQRFTAEENELLFTVENDGEEDSE